MGCKNVKWFNNCPIISKCQLQIKVIKSSFSLLPVVLKRLAFREQEKKYTNKIYGCVFLKDENNTMNILSAEVLKTGRCSPAHAVSTREENSLHFVSLQSETPGETSHRRWQVRNKNKVKTESKEVARATRTQITFKLSVQCHNFLS